MTGSATRQSSYPLRRLAELQERAVAQRRQDLADAMRLVDQIASDVERAEAACGQKSMELQEHRSRCDAGAVRAGALQLQDRYAERLEQERQGLLEEHRCARARLQQQQEAAQRAREDLASAQAECRATEKHRERWNRQEHQRRERRAEDEVDDLLRASGLADRDENQ